MTLSDWLHANDLTDAAFADRVGCNQTTINRARRHARVPMPALMKRIVAATNGDVQPNDFFGAPPEPRADRRQRAKAQAEASVAA